MIPNEVLDGVLLGDGHLQMRHHGGSASFRINLSGEEHLDWLYNIKGSLELLGIYFSPQYPKCHLKRSNFKEVYTEAYLQSRCHPLLTEQYYRYYKQVDGRLYKIVPSDLALTATCLAHWFMGDGTSRRDRRPKYSMAISVNFCTESFDIRSILHLEAMLHKLGVRTGRRHVATSSRYSAGIQITILQNSVNTLMDIIEPYVLPSYTYKIKRRTMLPRRGRKPAFIDTVDTIEYVKMKKMKQGESR